VDMLSYYTAQTAVTDPGPMTFWLMGLPSDLAGLRRVARQLVVHYRGGNLAENGITDDRLPEIHTRYAAAMLQRLYELDDRPIVEPRPTPTRIVGCCRDFTLLFLTLARHQGIPARVRVGLATYFVSGYALDHEIAEVWDAEAGRWRLIDVQLTDEHTDPNDGFTFDAMDVPRDRFLVGGTAWLACRNGEADPERFVVDPNLDIPETRGWRQIRHDLLNDLVRLNRQELLLWDTWAPSEVVALSPDQERLIDEVARLTAEPATSWTAIRAIYDDNPWLQVPAVVTREDPLGGPSQLVLLKQ
jgi:hypothetical protein